MAKKKKIKPKPRTSGMTSGDLATSKFLKQLRINSDISQADLASSMTQDLGKDVAQNLIYLVESEKRKVTVDEFIGWTRICGRSPSRAISELEKIMKH